jgi:hypothetical protein
VAAPLVCGWWSEFNAGGEFGDGVEVSGAQAVAGDVEGAGGSAGTNGIMKVAAAGEDSGDSGGHRVTCTAVVHGLQRLKLHQQRLIVQQSEAGAVRSADEHSLRTLGAQLIRGVEQGLIVVVAGAAGADEFLVADFEKGDTAFQYGSQVIAGEVGDDSDAVVVQVGGESPIQVRADDGRPGGTAEDRHAAPQAFGERGGIELVEVMAAQRGTGMGGEFAAASVAPVVYLPSASGLSGDGADGEILVAEQTGDDTAGLAANRGAQCHRGAQRRAHPGLPDALTAGVNMKFRFGTLLLDGDGELRNRCENHDRAVVGHVPVSTPSSAFVVKRA